MADDDTLPDDDVPEELPPLEPSEGVGSKKAVRKRTRRLKAAAEESEEFWRAAFSSKVGRREMWRLLQFLHPFETRHVSGPNGFPAQQATLMALGEQQMGVRIYRWWMKMDRDGVALMEAENDPEMSTSEKPDANIG